MNKDACDASLFCWLFATSYGHRRSLSIFPSQFTALRNDSLEQLAPITKQGTVLTSFALADAT